MPKILLCDYKEPMARDLEIEKEMLQNGILDDVQVETLIYEDDNDALIAALADVDALLTAYIPLDDALLSRMEHVKFISIEASGYNCIDLEAATKYGIGVSCIQEYCTQEVADHAMALALAVSRNIKVYTHDIEVNHRFDFMMGQHMVRLEGSTFGIMGLGKIGRAIAKRAQGFGMKVIAYTPSWPEALAKELDIELVSKEDLLRRSHFISLNMLLTDETTHTLDRAAFEQMEQRPVIINVSRGPLIDEEALIWALDNGKIYGAGLDVLVDETYEGTVGNPLVGRTDVIVTPHAAFYSDVAMRECSSVATSNILHYLNGENHKVKRMLNTCTVEAKTL